jgi:adenosylmethionine-8-amino-7-oxononanoate aminotransferase
MGPYPELGKALKWTALENGLIMRIDPTWFAVSPALVADNSEIDEMCSLIELSLRQALEAVAVKRGAAA